MRVAITVTAVFDLPDEVEVEDILVEGGALMPHFIVKDRRFRPYVDFDLVDDDIDAEEWSEAEEEEIEDIYELFDESLDAEQYTVVNLDRDDE